MAGEEAKEYLRELRRIRIALYLIVVVLALIAMSLALNFWAESTRAVKMSQGKRSAGATGAMRTPQIIPVSGSSL